MTATEIAWLVPCYNEAMTIGKVVRDIRAACPGSSVYVYDNGSSDDTARLAAEAGAHVVIETRRGKGNVVRRMFDDIDADLYLLVDGDDTYRIEDWMKLAGPVLRGEADMVVASRLGEYQPGSFRPLHFFGNRLIVGLVNFFFGTEFKDVLTGYRAFSRRFVKLVSLHAKGFELETELTIQALEHRFRIQETPLPYRSRPMGSTSKLRTFHDGFIVNFFLLKLVKDHKPLTFCGVLAIALAIAAWLMQSRFHLTYEALTFFIGSLIAGFSGLVLHFVAQGQKELVQILGKTQFHSRRLSPLPVRDTGKSGNGIADESGREENQERPDSRAVRRRRS